MQNSTTAKKILLVDHQENIFASVFSGKGLVQVPSCIEAINKLVEQAFSFSLILLNHQVRINEVEMLGLIKEQAKKNNIKVFFCSQNYLDLLPC